MLDSGNKFFSVTYEAGLPREAVDTPPPLEVFMASLDGARSNLD